MKTIVISVFSIIALLAIGFIILFNSTTKTNQDRNWIIEIAIYPAGRSSTYFIQIDENNVIRTRFGSRRNLIVTSLYEELVSDVRYEEESVLNDDEMLTVLTLVRELEATGGIDETGISTGTWEVVLTYNGIRYAMDYRVAFIAVNIMEETFHEGAYPLSHYEIFMRLVDEIADLSPIKIEEL